ncbi:MAG: DNA alkylation repair protein [Actinobacteria bacterium]|nr:DNA alkylation repair protein [Actinomycetota bacterium]
MDATAAAEVLHRKLRALGTAERAQAERAYLKSELRHLGTSVPATRAVVKDWLRSHGELSHDELFALADALWVLPVHECRMAAVELLVARPTLIGLDDVPWLYNTLRDCRTWALLDTIAGSVVADLAARQPDDLLAHLDRWVHDPDFWIRRSAVLALRTLLRRDQQLDRFFAYAEQLLPEKEFFIRKVIGWVAREVAVRHPAEVSRWLRANMAGMNLVTLREPLRKLPDAVELRALYDKRRNNDG